MLRSGSKVLKQLYRYNNCVTCISRTPVVIGKRKHHHHAPATGSHDKDESIVLYADSKEAARQDLLKLGFHEPTSSRNQKQSGSDNDLFYTYLKHINTAFKSSAKNYNKLMSYMEQNDSKISDDQRLSYIFKYLLTESQLEINRLRTMSVDEIARRKLERSRELASSNTSSSQHLENLVLNDLLYNNNEEEEDTDASQISLINTISLIQLLKDTLSKAPTTWNQPYVTGLSIPDIVEAFECFKLVPIQKVAHEGILYSGLLLYNLGTVRLDPVNESFYINSLVAFGEFKRAFELFISYRDTVREKWWDSIGLMVLLAGNNMKGFWRLLSSSKGVDPEGLSPRVIKLGLRKFIQINDLQKAKVLTQLFLRLVDKYGVDENEKNNNNNNDNNVLSKFVEFQNEDEANRYLNAVERPTRDDFITIINYYTKVKDLEMLGILIAKFLEVVPSSKGYNEVLLKTNLCLLQDFDSLTQLISGCCTSVPSNDANLQILKEKFQTILQRYGDCEDLNTKVLLFNNINSLIGNPNVAQTVKQILGSAAVSMSSSSSSQPLQSSVNTKATRSELYKNLLQLLLFSNPLSPVKNETKALEILKCMEECDEENPTVYVRPNAYHYAVFIDYYASRLKTGGKNKNKSKKRDKVLVKIDSILHRMQKLQIEPNDKFLSKLLFLYNKLNDFNSCFEIINSVLEKRTNPKEQVVVSQRNWDNVATGTGLHGGTPISMGLYYSIWMTYNRLYSLASVELSEVTEKSNYKLWRPVVKQHLEKLNVQPRYELAWILNNMINVDNVMPNYTFYRLIVGTLMKARDWELVPAVLTLMSDKHGCQIDLSFVRFVLEGIRREFVVHRTHEILSETKSSDSGIDYATARTMAIEAFRANKGFLSTFNVNHQSFSSSAPDNPYDLLIQQVLRLLKYKNPYDTQFTGVLEQCKYLDIDPGRIMNVINR